MEKRRRRARQREMKLTPPFCTTEFTGQTLDLLSYCECHQILPDDTRSESGQTHLYPTSSNDAPISYTFLIYKNVMESCRSRHIDTYSGSHARRSRTGCTVSRFTFYSAFLEVHLIIHSFFLRIYTPPLHDCLLCASLL